MIRTRWMVLAGALALALPACEDTPPNLVLYPDPGVTHSDSLPPRAGPVTIHGTLQITDGVIGLKQGSTITVLEDVTLEFAQFYDGYDMAVTGYWHFQAMRVVKMVPEDGWHRPDSLI